MGVFTVGRQVALEIDMPGWWLANASVDMDFRRGLYYDSSTANPRAATDFLSCVRASVGYAKTAEGTLTQFASNVLRVTSNGLLVEDARTNFCLQSQAFTTGAIWDAESPPTVTDNAIAAPDGTTTAALLNDASAGALQYIHQGSGSINLAAGTWCYSVYAKANTSSIIDVSLSGVADVAAYFQLTGSGSFVAKASTTAPTSMAIESLANGWYRCSVVYTHASGLMQNIRIVPAARTDMTGSDEVASVTGSLYLWGVQIEAGAFPSSYIPTTGAAATRAADAVTPIGGLNTVLTTLPQSIVADAIIPTITSFNRIVGDENVDQRNLIVVNNSNSQVQIYNGANSLVATLGGSLTWSTGVKVGSSQATAQRSIVGGGGTVATDTNTAVASDQPTIGRASSGAQYFNGYLRRLTVWNSKLADATLQGFTV